MAEHITENPNKALTGVRPTGDLTMGNYLGALRPIVEMQNTFDGPVSVFVADMHGLTDQEPRTVNRTILGTARSLVAAGVDPRKTTLFLQSEIEAETLYLANLFDRHTTPAELSRVPTLKDKLRDGQDVSNISMAMFRYPVLMAADIAIQDATHVPVGQDQLPHIELTRELVRRFNKRYGKKDQVLIEPLALSREALRIAALKGEGKMSKSSPDSALLLNDSESVVARKIKRAQTGLPGDMNPILQSHFTMAKLLCTTDGQRTDLESLRVAHQAGQPVMAHFKDFLTERVNTFLGAFRERFDSISDAEAKKLLIEGSEQARGQADQVVSRVRRALGSTSLLA